MEQFSVLLPRERPPNSIGPSCYVWDIRAGSRWYRIVIDCGAEFGKDNDLIGPDLSYFRDGKKIDAIIITHGHFDHLGYLYALFPYLSDDLKIYASPQTRRMLGKMVRNLSMFHPKLFNMFAAVKILDDDAHFDLRPGENEILSGVTVFAVPAGHVPGALSVVLRFQSGGKGLVTGDMCFHHQPVVKGADLLSTILPREWFPDYILGTDLTYGTGTRKDWNDQMTQLANKVGSVLERGGKAVVAAFEFGRGQNVALELARRGFKPYVDGGIREVFGIFQESQWSAHDERFSLDGISFIEAKFRDELIDSHEPLVVVTTAGMGSGGPFPGYAVKSLPRENDAIIFTSYLAPGSPGNRIIEAHRQGEQKIEGLFDEAPEPLQLNADVESFSLSAHGDLDDMNAYVADIVRVRNSPLEGLVLTHGTDESKRIAQERLGHLAKQTFPTIVTEEMVKQDRHYFVYEDL